KSVVPTGAWRAPSHNFTAFVIETVIDELAHQASVDPVQLRMKFLGTMKDIPFSGDDPTPYNPDRLKGVLQMAAEKGGWGKPSPPGIGRGIACHYTFGGYSAICMDVSMQKETIKIHRVVIALDCGIPAHLGGLEAQAQGGVIDGIGSSFFGAITIKDGGA